ncbi:MAG TPA: VOC family protein [Thermoanaerobaculia bacterium]|nr:VOC family protein [Thermoanaerobaculia bacterium]
MSENSAQLVAEVVVPDLGKTIDFLTALGFRVERIDGTFAVLRWDDSYLFVAEDAGAKTTARWINIRVIVPDVDAMWSKATQLGRIVTMIGDRSYGLRDFIVAGPFGVEIRFAQII